MEIVQTLNAPAAYIYQKIIDSVIFDIRKQTGKALTPAELKGFSYKKTFSQRASANVKITESILNQSYHYQTTSNHNVFEAGYDLFDEGNQTAKVVYSEKMSSEGLIQQANDTITSLLLGHMRKKNFKKMLKQIEESYA